MAAFTTEHQHKAASDMSSDEKKEAKKLATAAKKAVKSLATKQEKVENIKTGEKEKQSVYPKAKSQFEAGKVAFKAGECAQAEAAFKQVPRGSQPTIRAWPRSENHHLLTSQFLRVNGLLTLVCLFENRPWSTFRIKTVLGTRGSPARTPA